VEPIEVCAESIPDINNMLEAFQYPSRETQHMGAMMAKIVVH
jgi:hypothetical protein